MGAEAQWFDEQRWRRRMVLVNLVSASARGAYKLGIVGVLGFALAGAVWGYGGWRLYGLVGSLVLSGVARVVVQRQTSPASSCS
jgi:hypothetical protein